MFLKSTPLSQQNMKAMMEKYQQELREFQQRSKLPQNQPSAKQEEEAIPVSTAPAAVEVSARASQPPAASPPSPTAVSSPAMQQQTEESAFPPPSVPYQTANTSPTLKGQQAVPTVPRNGTRLPFTPPETILDMPAMQLDINQGTGAPAEMEQPEEPEYSYEDLNQLPPAEDLEAPEGRISRQMSLEEIQERLETQNGTGEPPSVPPMASPEPRIFEPQAQYPGATDLASLQVQTFTAREALPVQGAVVTITSTTLIEGDKLQYVVVTDQNGFTPPVVVPATDRNLTLTPSADDIPITTYDILVVAPGFFRVRNRNVPGYGGIAAVQPVEMIPIPEMGDDGQERVYENTSPQNL